jgi:hypothetical protein
MSTSTGSHLQYMHSRTHVLLHPHWSKTGGYCFYFTWTTHIGSSHANSMVVSCCEHVHARARCTAPYNRSSALQAHIIGPPADILDARWCGSGDAPLVPHLVRAAAAPHVHLHMRTRRHMHRLPQRKENGKPGRHVGRVRGRVGAQGDTRVQLALEIPVHVARACIM